MAVRQFCADIFHAKIFGGELPGVLPLLFWNQQRIPWSAKGASLPIHVARIHAIRNHGSRNSETSLCPGENPPLELRTGLGQAPQFPGSPFASWAYGIDRSRAGGGHGGSYSYLRTSEPERFHDVSQNSRSWTGLAPTAIHIRTSEPPRIHKLRIFESKFLGSSLWTQEFPPSKLGIWPNRSPEVPDSWFVDWPWYENRPSSKRSVREHLFKESCEH